MAGAGAAELPSNPVFPRHPPIPPPSWIRLRYCGGSAEAAQNHGDLVRRVRAVRNQFLSARRSSGR